MDKTDRLRDYGLAFLLYKQGLSVCGYELIRELFIFIKLILNSYLFFDFKIKAKYLAFISCLLEKPDLSVKTALKSIFRKSQVRSISEKFGLNLNAQIVCLSPSQWVNCFLEMLEVVPEKFHPS